MMGRRVLVLPHTLRDVKCPALNQTQAEPSLLPAPQQLPYHTWPQSGAAQACRPPLVQLAPQPLGLVCGPAHNRGLPGAVGSGPG